MSRFAQSTTSCTLFCALNALRGGASSTYNYVYEKKNPPGPLNLPPYMYVRTYTQMQRGSGPPVSRDPDPGGNHQVAHAGGT